MWKTSFRLAVIILVVMSGSVFADSFTFTSAGGVTWGNVYVNPYTATDTTGGQLPANTALTIYCDDWNTDFSGYPTWNANVYSLTDAMTTTSVLTQLKYGNTPDALHRYLEVAWLDSQVPRSDTERIELAAAMWTLFAAGDKLASLTTAINNTPGYADAVSAYLGEARSAVDGKWDPSGWDVIVPDGPTVDGQQMQEFLYHDPTVPEPSAVILLGTVIGYLGLTKFRRKRQA